MSLFNMEGSIINNQTNITGDVHISNEDHVVQVGHIKFPKILSYANLVKELQYYADRADEPYPHINFNGTVKLHGTNAAIIRDTNDNFHYQSRKRMITPANDNAGFAQWCAYKNRETWHRIFNQIELVSGVQFKSTNIRIWGEFVGQGIQKGVAISQLPLSFFIFGVYMDSEGWLDTGYFRHVSHESQRIYNVHHFKNWDIDIDFNAPQAAVQRLEAISAEVGSQCPVGEELDLRGAGEGVVYSAIDTDRSNIQFKVVHEDFKEVSRGPKKRVKKDATPFENHVRACINEARCRKVIDKMKEDNILLTPQNTPIAIEYTALDVWEEETLILQEFGATFQDVKKQCGKIGGIYNQLIRFEV